MSFLTDLNKTLSAKYSKDNPTLVNPMKAMKVESFKSGCLTLDLISGFGGFIPRGHISEIVGANTSGKTTVCIQTCIEAQKVGVNSVYIDAEGVFDIKYSQALGLITEEEDLPEGYGTFQLLQPDYGEQTEGILDIMDEKLIVAATANKNKRLPEKDTVGLIIIDSVAASRPEEELKGNKRIGQHATLWSRISYKMKKMARSHNIGFALINQVRYAPSIGPSFSVGVLDSSQNNDGSENTTGGEALKFVYSVRWQLKGFSKITREVPNPLTGEIVEQRIGNLSKVTAIKNKLAPPLVQAQFAIEYGKGTVDYHVIEPIMKKQGHLTNRGSYLKYEPIDVSLIPNKDHETYPGYIYGRKRFNEWFRTPEVQADAARRITAFFNKEEIESVDTGTGTLDAEAVNTALSFDIEDLEATEDGDVKIKPLTKAEIAEQNKPKGGDKGTEKTSNTNQI